LDAIYLQQGKYYYGQKKYDAALERLKLISFDPMSLKEVQQLLPVVQADAEKAAAEKAAVNFLEAMVNSDFEEAGKYTGGVNPEYELERILESQAALFGPEQAKIQRLVLGQVKYEASKAKVDGGSASVSVKITAPDCQKITNQAMRSIMLVHSVNPSQDTTSLFRQLVYSSVDSPSAPTTMSNVTITLSREEGVWIVKLRGSDALLNALTGNLGNALGL
jgi:hypothetical protein